MSIVHRVGVLYREVKTVCVCGVGVFQLLMCACMLLELLNAQVYNTRITVHECVCVCLWARSQGWGPLQTD